MKNIFERKAYKALLEWKDKYSDRYAAFLVGARRVGKSTIAEQFARNEFENCIIVDFANLTESMQKVFEDIADLDVFFLRLQAETGIALKEGRSVIVFDEIQLAPKVRQAIKYLVKDGRYRYIETGSLISIKKNVKDIVIPSEEYKIDVHPMDYEEFLKATGSDAYQVLSQLNERNKPVGTAVNRKLMRDFRIYMAVGGMPQAVQSYVAGDSFSEIDFVKREIIRLYRDDFRKIDASGRISAMFDAIPAQLAGNSKKFVISAATGNRKTLKDEERLYELLDSKAVVACYNVTDPGVVPEQMKDFDSFKLYLADTGLFTSMIFRQEGKTDENIYSKLLGDKLKANMGYLYENAVAQIIRASGRDLYYHIWRPKGNSHNYEIDFLVQENAKVVPIEVKSSNVNNHKSIEQFCEKYSGIVSRRILFSQKDIGHDGMLEFKPIYLAPLILRSEAVPL